MSDNISIKGLDRAKVLAALYNGARAQGAGFIQYDSTPMGEKEARQLLQRQTNFDYLKGRVMKVNLSSDEIDPYLYDRDNGQGAFAKVINALRSTSDINPEEVELQHKEGTRNAAIVMEEHIDDPDYVKPHGGFVEYGLGVSDLAHLIRPKIKKILDEGDEESS